ncbi:peptidoglycan-binding protein [Phormidium sp. LEGE 05292]|uniref:peptidoglycan-binding domain-containing protein n=1 Tax=[Phormidium] sp. LEGE 05292 TaxID=767427 RepID=UPI0018825D24|nr:peptidoglycan-binding domain-containing protein [Phormidium sp. LEGE 05292]MBE9224732.1 peptidoglycan-binding protein [Phormidium sp. LEGE 05292]
MLKSLLTGSSVLLFLVAGTLSARAEAPPPGEYFYPEPTQPTQPLTGSVPIYDTLPQLSDGNLTEYAATDAIPVLQLGSRGVVVEDVQKFLQQAGLYTGAIDGIFGLQSQAAVAQFQTQARLTPDGIIGFDTWKALVRSQPS